VTGRETTQNVHGVAIEHRVVCPIYIFAIEYVISLSAVNLTHQLVDPFRAREVLVFFVLGSKVHVTLFVIEVGVSGVQEHLEHPGRKFLTAVVPRFASSVTEHAK
jgi:uncharacterized membrane protein